MQTDFNKFLKSLEIAGLRIEGHYFKPKVVETDELVYRERIYCYELYHQLRLALGDLSDYKLDGELDKTNHKVLIELQATKPDLVVHVPGRMDRNLVVVEVKPVQTNEELLEKDLNKLMRFLNEGRYYRAIMLVYDNGDTSLADWIKEKIFEKREPRLALVWHAGPGEKPEIVNS